MSVISASVVRIMPAIETAFCTAERVTLTGRSEEHTSELQSRQYLVCRLLLEKKKKRKESDILEISCTTLTNNTLPKTSSAPNIRRTCTITPNTSTHHHALDKLT